MSVRQVTLLFAVLAIFVALLAVGIAIWAILAARSDRWRDELQRFRDSSGTTMLLAAAIIGFVAISGSLYLSEVANFPPCRMCWYQRIAAYPLGPILLLAFVRRDHGIRPYIWLLTGAGLVLSSYHILLERFPSLEGSACEVDNPCTIKWVEHLGFITIPTMAWCAFASIGALAWLAGPRGND